MIANYNGHKVTYNIEQLQTPTMGVILNNDSTTTETPL